MACTSCSTADGGAPKGCGNKGNCGTDSCNKLTVFDWLSNMSLPNGEKPSGWCEHHAISRVYVRSMGGL